MSGIYLKLDWDEMIMDLEDASVGKMIKNAYNHMKNRDMIEMDIMELKLFKHVIEPVLKFNIERYKEVCERNAKNSKLGVEKKRQNKINETQVNQVVKIETQNNPSGNKDNPDYPKDRDKDRVKEIEKDKLNSKEIDTIKNRSDVEKMKKILELDLKNITNEKEIDFCIKVKEAVRFLDWYRFKLLVFDTEDQDVEDLLNDFDKLYCLQGILDIKCLYPFILDSIIK